MQIIIKLQVKKINMLDTNVHQAPTQKAILKEDYNFTVNSKTKRLNRRYSEYGQIARTKINSLREVFDMVSTGTVVLQYLEYNSVTKENEIKERTFDLIKHKEDLKSALSKMSKAEFRGFKYKKCRQYSVSNPCKSGTKRNAKNFLYAEAFILDIDLTGEEL